MEKPKILLKTKDFEVFQYKNENNLFRVKPLNPKIRKWLGKDIVGIGIREAFNTPHFLKNKRDAVIFFTKNGEKSGYMIAGFNIFNSESLKDTIEDIKDDLLALAKKHGTQRK